MTFTMPRRNRREEESPPRSQRNDGVRIQPVPMKEDSSIYEYLRYFERVKTANNWSDNTAGKIFMAMLPPKERCLDSVQEVAGFDEIRQKLSEYQVPFREANLKELIAVKKQDNESVQSFADRVAKLVELVYPKFEVNIQKQLTRDFFLHGLPSQTREGVINSRSSTLEDTVNAARMSESLLQNRENVYATTTKRNDPEHDGRGDSEGTTAAIARRDFSEGNQKFMHHVPLRRGRFSTKGEVRSEWQKRDLRKVRCYGCQGYGHYKSNCPTVYQNRFSEDTAKRSENED